MTEQAAAPALEGTIEIGDDNNTLHPQTARKKGCENNLEDESLFSDKSDNDHDDNDPDDDYSASTS